MGDKGDFLRVAMTTDAGKCFDTGFCTGSFLGHFCYIIVEVRMVALGNDILTIRVFHLKGTGPGRIVCGHFGIYSEMCGILSGICYLVDLVGTVLDKLCLDA